MLVKKYNPAPNTQHLKPNTHTFMLLDIAIGPPSPVTSRPEELLLFLPVGYLVTVLVETPVLLFGLSPKLTTLRQRLFAGLWLTACTYPVVVLVLPFVFASSPRSEYLLVAETFAPVAECLLFWLAFARGRGARRGALARSFAAIVVANLLSFVAGEILGVFGWFGLV